MVQEEKLARDWPIGLLLGGGDNWSKLELSFAHLPRGAHGIYKHILFYWYPTFFARKKTLTKKLVLTNFPLFCPENIHSESFILLFSHSRSILEQNVPGDPKKKYTYF